MSSSVALARDWTPRSIYALALLALICAFNYLDRSILSLVLPQVKTEMQLSDTALGLVSGFACLLVLPAEPVFLLIADLVGQVLGPLIVGAVCAALGGAVLIGASRTLERESRRAGKT